MYRENFLKEVLVLGNTLIKEVIVGIVVPMAIFKEKQCLAELWSQFNTSKDHLPREMESKSYHLNHCPPTRPHPPILPKTVPPTGDQALRCGSLWRPFSLKPPQPPAKNGTECSFTVGSHTLFTFQVILPRLTVCECQAAGLAAGTVFSGWRLKLLLFCLTLLFKHRVSLCSLSSPGWPWVCDPPASAF